MNPELLRPLGDVYIKDRFLIFFGNKLATLEKISQVISREHSILKQVHGTACTKAKIGVDHTEADAQWTDNNKLLPLIKTADCLPIMIIDSNSNKCLSIHAGWKGVKNKVAPASIQGIGVQDPSALKVWIGPHLQKESFEVDRDVSDEIFSGINRDDHLVSQKWDKFYIKLSEIIVRQLIPLGILREQIQISEIDTRYEDMIASLSTRDDILFFALDDNQATDIANRYVDVISLPEIPRISVIDGHPNPEGHRIIADSMQAFIQEAIEESC